MSHRWVPSVCYPGAEVCSECTASRASVHALRPCRGRPPRDSLLDIGLRLARRFGEVLRPR